MRFIAMGMGGWVCVSILSSIVPMRIASLTTAMTTRPAGTSPHAWRAALREQKEDFYLTVSRMVPYKKIPLIVEAFGHLPQRRR